MGLPLRSPVANYRCEWPYMAKSAESSMKRSVFDCSWILARSLLRIADFVQAVIETDQDGYEFEPVVSELLR